MKSFASLQPSIFRFFLAGLLTTVLLVELTFGVYFEQWDWKILLWVHNYHENLQPLFSIGSGILTLVTLSLLLTVLLPTVASMLLKSKRQLWSLVCFSVTAGVGITTAYIIGELGLVGKNQIGYVLRDVATNWYSFVFVTGSLVLLPLLLITLGMWLWQKRGRKERTERTSPS